MFTLSRNFGIPGSGQNKDGVISMSFREAFPLPPDCALREDFPDGVVYVQTVGSEAYDGPTHVDLYGESWQATPRVPRLHLTLDAGSEAAGKVESALRKAHEQGEGCSDEDYVCIALDSLGVIARRHGEREAASV